MCVPLGFGIQFYGLCRSGCSSIMKVPHWFLSCPIHHCCLPPPNHYIFIVLPEWGLFARPWWKIHWCWNKPANNTNKQRQATKSMVGQYMMERETVRMLQAPEWEFNQLMARLFYISAVVWKGGSPVFDSLWSYKTFHCSIVCSRTVNTFLRN